MEVLPPNLQGAILVAQLVKTQVDQLTGHQLQIMSATVDTGDTGVK